jgi:hypothetical protein
LKKGQQYITGSREELLASTFKNGKSVLLVTQDGHDLLATNANATRDELEDAPLF